MTTLFEATFDNTNDWHHKCRQYEIGAPTYTELDVGNIFVPGEFDYCFFQHGKPVAHDPTNLNGYAQPEGHHESIDQYAYRVYEGYAAWMCFGFYRIIRTGLGKKITVPSNGKLIITGHAMGWSSTNDNAFTSDGVTGDYSADEGAPGLTDNQKNHTFWVGLGEPFNHPTLNKGKHIYNGYDELKLEIDVIAGEYTVFIMGATLWPFHHNNFYFDSFRVEFEPTVIQPLVCKGLPREDFERMYVLLHPGANEDWIRAVLDSGAWANLRITMGGSADDAALGDLSKRTVLATKPATWNGNLAEFFDEYYEGTTYIPINVNTPEELRLWLIDWMNSSNPTPPPQEPSRLLSPGLHLTTGDSGASDYYKRLVTDLPPDVVPPSIKAYGTPSTMGTLKLFKNIDDRILTVGRLSEDLHGHNIEGVDLTGDLRIRAEEKMARSMAAWEAHRTYVDVWEIINEQDPPGIEGQAKLAVFFMHCMDIATANGYIIAIFSHSLGVPEWDEMQAVVALGCLEQAKRQGHYIAVHEYDYPLDRLYGQPITGTPPNPNRGCLAFRYRYWVDAVGGIENMPDLLLTEVNVYTDMRTINPADWDAQIRWYMSEVSKDSYVKGVHIFGWGSLGGAWADLDIKRGGLEELWYNMVLDFSEEEAPGFMPIAFSQRNPLWASDKMLPSACTVGASGCAMTAATSLASMLDRSLTPKIMNDWLSRDGGYLSDGRLMWTKVAERVDGMKYIWYHVWPVGADLIGLTAMLEKAPVVIKVDFYPGGTIQSHFVLALGIDGDDILILDPWTGTERYLLAAYGDGIMNLENVVLAAVEYSMDFDEPPLPPQEELTRGVHCPPITDPPYSHTELINRLKDMNITWYKILHNGNHGNYELLGQLMAAGIQPVVRIYDDHQFPGRNQVIVNNSATVKRIIDIIRVYNVNNGTKFKPYIEGANEPNLTAEWQPEKTHLVDWHNDESVQQVSESIWSDMQAILEWGGYPAFPAFAHTDRGGTNPQYSGYVWATRVFSKIYALNPVALSEGIEDGTIWVSDHSATMARPFTFDPYKATYIDDMCLRGFQPLSDFIEQIIGVKPLILITEGGVFSPTHMSQLGWSDCVRNGVVYYEGTDRVFYDNNTWGNIVKNAFEFLRMPAMFWHLKDVGNEWDGAGWYDQNWNERSPVDYLKG